MRDEQIHELPHLLGRGIGVLDDVWEELGDVQALGHHRDETMECKDLAFSFPTDHDAQQQLVYG